MEQMPSQRLLAATWKLFNASLEAGLTLLIQTASEIYQAPVVYTNELFQIRAMYPNHPTGQVNWDQIYEQRYLPLDEIWKILDENLSGAEPFYRPFYADSGLCRDLPRLFGEVVRNKTVRGHVIVYLGSSPLQGDDLAIMDTLTELLRQKATAGPLAWTTGPRPSPPISSFCWTRAAPNTWWPKRSMPLAPLSAAPTPLWSLPSELWPPSGPSPTTLPCSCGSAFGGQSA